MVERSSIDVLRECYMSTLESKNLDARVRVLSVSVQEVLTQATTSAVHWPTLKHHER